MERYIGRYALRVGKNKLEAEHIRDLCKRHRKLGGDCKLFCQLLPIGHHTCLLEWRVGSALKHSLGRYPRLYELRTVSDLRSVTSRYYDSCVLDHGPCNHAQRVTANGSSGSRLDSSDRYCARMRD
jgi:hypothetical protein